MGSKQLRMNHGLLIDQEGKLKQKFMVEEQEVQPVAQQGGSAPGVQAPLMPGALRTQCPTPRRTSRPAPLHLRPPAVTALAVHGTFKHPTFADSLWQGVGLSATWAPSQRKCSAPPPTRASWLSAAAARALRWHFVACPPARTKYHTLPNWEGGAWGDVLPAPPNDASRCS